MRGQGNHNNSQLICILMGITSVNNVALKALKMGFKQVNQQNRLVGENRICRLKQAKTLEQTRTRLIPPRPGHFQRVWPGSLKWRINGHRALWRAKIKRNFISQSKIEINQRERERERKRENHSIKMND